jgi:two-component system, cell cycle response regulator
MKVLIAEDDRVTLRLLESRLRRWGYDVITAPDGKQAWDILQEDDCPRLALVDWMMPEMDGLEVCKKVRKLVPEPYRYIIMLTAKGGQEDIVEGLEAGADDYLTKPVEMQELKVRLRAGERIVDLQNQLLNARDALKYQASHDMLTGLWNRTTILDAIDREFSRATRERSPVAVVMADIDFFKKVNDTHGHPAGDAVLRTVSARLKDGMRRYDSIGRYGGEEFLFILPGCDAINAEAQTDRLRRLVSETAAEHEGLTIPVTLSLGVAIFDGNEEADPDLIIKHADEALYRAKANGRNRVEMA